MSESEPKPLEQDESRLASIDNSDTDSNSSDSETDTKQSPTPTEWLATTREKRSTAGNRMKSMLANEEPDSDLELLFAEDDDDQGFTDIGDNASDVHMDSSSDDEEDNNPTAGDDDGEKELERQAKEKRAAQRKRKANQAIPTKLRKKVRIDSTVPTEATAQAPVPRPKKKSERASWLPTEAEMPTRASSRSTTRTAKDQLHAQLRERDVRRQKQVHQMAKKAAENEALKKPPMTQEERLKEAALVERRNAKSLNRWEEAEKIREEERRAKLAALNERTLKGPVLTFWSGTRQWKDGGSARYVVMEEKPKRKPRPKENDKEKMESKQEGPSVGDVVVVVDLQQPPSKGPSQEPEQKPPAEPSQQPPVTTTLVSGMAMPPMPPPPSGLAAPVPPPQNIGIQIQTPESKPSSVLAAPVLAPPASTDLQRTSPPVSKSSVLALPNPPPPPPPPLPTGKLDTPASNTPSEAPPDPKEKEESTYTRNSIVYQNFNENAIRDKTVQTQILFGRKMSRLASKSPSPLNPPPLPLSLFPPFPSQQNNLNRLNRTTPHAPLRNNQPPRPLS